MLIFENGFVMPNQLFIIGARAMIGVELTAIANGMTPSLIKVQRAVAKAMPIPNTLPIAKPPTASRIVNKPAGRTTRN